MDTPLRMGSAASRVLASAALIAAVFLLGCSSSNSNSTPPTYTIGGTVSGLAGSGLVLQDNGGNNLSVSASGAFTFTTAIAMGSAYSVTVFAQPSNVTQNCVPTVASGTVGSANVTTVVVTCTTSKFTVGGTVATLAGSGLVLQDNLGNNLPVSASGAFTFTTSIASGSAYSVTVFSQPSNVTQTCVPTVASGTVTTGNVTTVVVTCTTNSFTVGGSVSGLLGSGLVLQDNGGNNLPISANGSFTFTTAVASGAAFSVAASTEPATPAQVCNVTGGGGTVTSGAITTVSVNCVTTVAPTTALALADFSNNRALIFNAPFSSDQAAIVVLGEPDFLTSTGGTTAATMSSPSAVAEDHPGTHLYVAENGNCRVIQFVAPFTNGMSASVVFGQTDLVSANNCGTTATITASSLGNTDNGSGGDGDNVFGVLVDTSGNLWIADNGANRVLKYAPPFTNGMAATLVIGQANFTSGATNQGGVNPTSASLSDPVPFFDLSGNLWVADYSNNRVLEFKAPFSTGMAASLVLGQANFTSDAANENGAIAANTLSGPDGGAFDALGNLWINDFFNNRVLEFVPPFTTNMAASLVLGQADLVSGGANTTKATLSAPAHVSFDSSGNLFVADEANNRTLMFTPPFATGMPASLVLGQSDFTSAVSATTATGESFPSSASPLPPPF